MISTKRILEMAIVLSTFTGFASHASVTSETEASSKALGAKMANEISFEEGKTSLTDTSKQEIRDFIKTARDQGKIGEVKVAVWADREYPSPDTKASDADVKLANERAKELKGFLKKELAVNDVNTYNMTQRPNALQKFIHTPTANMKNTMEKMGAAPTTEKETGLFNQKAQASK
ncbi:MAG: hypothetical protein ACKOX6_01425, partial [Bdellovibrio sp.]